MKRLTRTEFLDLCKMETPSPVIQLQNQDPNNQDQDLCLKAVKQYGSCLPTVTNQTDEICLAAVKKDGQALRFVEEQTERICLAAVRQSGMVLKYIQNPTHQIILSALREDGLALQFVQGERTTEYCIEAVKQNADAMPFVTLEFAD